MVATLLRAMLTSDQRPPLSGREFQRHQRNSLLGLPAGVPVLHRHVGHRWRRSFELVKGTAGHFSRMQGPKKKANPPSYVPGAVTQRSGPDTAIIELQPCLGVTLTQEQIMQIRWFIVLLALGLSACGETPVAQKGEKGDQ